MYLFIDETEEQKANNNSKSNFFVIVGLLVQSDKLFVLQNELIRLDEEFSGLKKHRGSPEVKTQIQQLLVKHECRVIAIVQDNCSRTKENVHDLYISALRFLFERVTLYVCRKNKKVLTIFDTLNGLVSRKLQKDFPVFIKEEFQEWFSTGEINRFSEHFFPWFLESSDEGNMLLVATDCIAYEIRNAVLEAKKVDDGFIPGISYPEVNKRIIFFKKIFLARQDGVISGYGIKIWN